MIGSTGAVIAMLAGPAAAQDDESDVDAAQELVIPLAKAINVPFNSEFDPRYGVGAARLKIETDPLAYYALNERWNLIALTEIPFDLYSGLNRHGGLEDTIESVAIAPNHPGQGFNWGFGASFLLPTATQEALGYGRWGVGPVGEIVERQGPWTLGLFVRQIWSFTSGGDGGPYDKTVLQPFVSYTTPDAWTYKLDSHAEYDWAIREASVPITGTVSKLVHIGDRRVSLSLGLRYYAASTDTGARDLAIRFGVTFLFGEK